MNDGPTEPGIINYLVYLVFALGSTIFGLVQRHFSMRLTTAEDRIDTHGTAIHDMEIRLKDQMTENNEVWDKRFEARRKENKQDFKDLHSKIDKNQSVVLNEIRKCQ